MRYLAWNFQTFRLSILFLSTFIKKNKNFKCPYMTQNILKVENIGIVNADINI